MQALGWFKEEWERAKDTFDYKLESLELEVTERILEIMEEKGISRSELAERLGVSKAAISKLLNNGSNMTLKRLLTIAEALDHEVRVDLGSVGHRIEENVIQYDARRKHRPPECLQFEGFIMADDYLPPVSEDRHAFYEY
jgi:transcriptional regulator with XRE-family HTH domain